MTHYKLISENTESTVVAEYQSEYKKKLPTNLKQNWRKLLLSF